MRGAALLGAEDRQCLVAHSSRDIQQRWPELASVVSDATPDSLHRAGTYRWICTVSQQRPLLLARFTNPHPVSYAFEIAVVHLLADLHL